MLTAMAMSRLGKNRWDRIHKKTCGFLRPVDMGGYTSLGGKNYSVEKAIKIYKEKKKNRKGDYGK
ncbi:MAG: hypothetical protein O2807_11110 [bacterium]|nr:hypothetical protein [bacterium]